MRVFWPHIHDRETDEHTEAVSRLLTNSRSERVRNVQAVTQ